jgi:hypothetical protein
VAVSPAAGTFVSLAVFAALVLPPGYAALRLARSSSGGIAGLAAAVGLGWAVVLPVLLLEVVSGARFLVLLMALGALAWLRPARGALRGARALAPDLVLPLALGALFLAANGSDFRQDDAGVSLRLGFDVSDRVYYSLVADELLRAAPHRLENPVQAPLPLQYSLFPALAGLLLRRYACAPGLAAFVWQLPALGAIAVGLAVAGLLAEWGLPRPSRIVTTVLVVLGGDLSFLAVAANRTGLERSAHFFTFHSFAAEALLYNPWVWGLPLTLVAVLLAGRWLAGGSRRELALLALVAGALWQTKVFAFLTLAGAALATAAWRRSGRLAAVAAACVVGGLPWMVLTASSPGAAGWPLRLAPLRPVRLSLEVNATLRSAATVLGDAPPLVLLLGTVLFLAGAIGLRLIGLPRLVREARADASGLHALVAAAIATGLAVSLTLRGHPMPVDGIQFLMLALYLSWLYAGPALAGPGRRRILVAVPLVALAVAAPVTSLARKLAPERFTSPASLDRVRMRLRSDTVAAAARLRAASPPGARVVLPLAGDPEDVGGMKPLLVAALARRRVVAHPHPLGVPAATAQERVEWVERVYSSGDPAVVGDALDRLGAGWVWEDAARPLHAAPPGWSASPGAPGIRLLTREPSPR